MKHKKNRGEDAMPDLACTRCRERKIRCGRERPHCRNCEREGGVICLYRIPAKRVNHLKLLCGSIERLQDRLTIIESHLSRLQGLGPRTPGFEEDHESSQPRTLLEGVSATSSCVDIDDEEEHKQEVSGILAPKQSKYYFGRSCVAALCENLKHFCEITKVSEPIPLYSDRLVVPLLPRQQATAAIDRFLQNLDCQTDVFVPDNLSANLQRLHSQHQPQPDDAAWGICFQTITLLARVTSQAMQGLLENFVHSSVPSRAVVVCPGLLNTPRLINVQALLLLSVAAQFFDYSGSAELIFAHACTLARILGLNCSQASDHGDIEQVERGKLCATSDELGKHSTRLHLAMLQEDIHRLAQVGSISANTHDSQELLMRIEKQLDENHITRDKFSKMRG
ncbi:C6 transcription factor [Aspergillus luchuensis]|uniref:C6 transcription factor n=1 Tax=Aspergillus kawachii TaxID=1069201 RepID=A0A146FWV9_ASPKA|nr:C6 transcription factor [Aspergillus luchuensis IFO 4308]GAT29838.1 C6 transcription factor [Aspergillus luchuensis]